LLKATTSTFTRETLRMLRRCATLFVSTLLLANCSTETSQGTIDAGGTASRPDAAGATPDGSSTTPDAPLVVDHPDAATGGAPDAPPANPDAPTGFACTTARLYEGNPSADEPNLDDSITEFPWKPSGKDPTVELHQFVFADVGGTTFLITYDEKRFWAANLGDPEATRKFIKIAGTTDNGPLAVGKCSDATIKIPPIHGIALVPGATDGTFMAAIRSNDDLNNPGSLIKVSDPVGANCKIELVGQEEQFHDPIWPIFLGGALYFIEENGDISPRQITKIAGDGTGTVSKVIDFTDTPIGDDNFVTGVITLNGKIYLAGTNADGGGVILELDPANPAAFHVIKDGDRDLWGGTVNGLTTDGTGLMVWSAGVVDYVTLDGHIRPIAGDFDFQTGADVIDAFPDYDYHVEKNAQAAAAFDSPLLVSRVHTSSEDSPVFLHYQAGELYFVGSFSDNTFASFTEELDCKAP
jgi:hypothetical protein